MTSQQLHLQRKVVLLQPKISAEASYLMTLFCSSSHYSARNDTRSNKPFGYSTTVSRQSSSKHYLIKKRSTEDWIEEKMGRRSTSIADALPNCEIENFPFCFDVSFNSSWRTHTTFVFFTFFPSLSTEATPTHLSYFSVWNLWLAFPPIVHNISFRFTGFCIEWRWLLNVNGREIPLRRRTSQCC